jgi:LysR family hydrogen peroxide-inducible transcriptional activator
MTLTELRYVVTLAQEQHFRRAAELCHVSQPTLSVAIKKLEDELGVALFERSRLGVHVTPVGERIVQRARRVLEQMAEIKDIADEGKDQLTGALALGTLLTIGPYLLPQCIPLLQKMAGNMPLYVEEAPVAILGKKLRRGELDVLIVSLPFSEPDVVVQPLFDEPFVVLLPVHHPLANQTAIAVEDMDPKEVMLLRAGHCFREQVLAALPGLQLSADDGQRTSTQGTTLETLRHMTASGLGITILPLSAAETPFFTADWLVTRPFTDPVPYRTLALAWRASFPRPKAVDVLRKAVQACSAAYWNYSTGRDSGGSGVMIDNRDW